MFYYEVLWIPSSKQPMLAYETKFQLGALKHPTWGFVYLIFNSLARKTESTSHVNVGF